MSARDLFYDDNATLPTAEERAFAREELVYNVTEDLLILLEDLGINKKELAYKMGKSKSYISQVLSGARNMTLGSLSDICFAIDADINIKVTPKREKGSGWQTTAPKITHFRKEQRQVVYLHQREAWAHEAA